MIPACPRLTQLFYPNPEEVPREENEKSVIELEARECVANDICLCLELKKKKIATFRQETYASCTNDASPTHSKQ